MTRTIEEQITDAVNEIELREGPSTETMQAIIDALDIVRGGYAMRLQEEHSEE
jgi:hypothetical protein